MWGLHQDTTTGTDRDEAVQRRLKAIGDSQVFFLVPLDHQFVHHHDVAVWDGVHGLDAEGHDRDAALVDLDLPLVARDPVDPTRTGPAGHLEVAAPHN